MEISTYEAIKWDFGTQPVYSRNKSAFLLNATTLTIDDTLEGAIGYLVNGILINSQKGGRHPITLNGEFLLEYFTPAAGLNGIFLPILVYRKLRTLKFLSTDTNCEITIFYQFINAGERLPEKGKDEK